MPQSPITLPWISPANDPLFVYALPEGAKENAFWFHVDGPSSTREELEAVARLARSAPELRKAGRDAAEVLRFVCCRLEIEKAEAHARGQSAYILAAHHADIVKACADMEAALEKAGPMKNKHTPGPWTYDAATERILGADGHSVGHLATDAEHHANQYLQAAAPELLEALRKIMRHLPNHGGCSLSADIDLANRAIAKARGK